MDIRKVVAANLTRLREEAELTQEALAGESEVHRTYVSGVERGMRNPTVVVLDRLAKALKVPTAALLEPLSKAERPTPKRRGRPRGR